MTIEKHMKILFTTVSDYFVQNLEWCQAYQLSVQHWREGEGEGREREREREVGFN
jgi:hypothetical protein